MDFSPWALRDSPSLGILQQLLPSHQDVVTQNSSCHSCLAGKEGF